MNEKIQRNLETLKAYAKDKNHGTLMHSLGIEIDYLGADKVVARMPVDERTRQYYGMLHGGASVALAETLVSIGAAVHIDMDKQKVVGQEINANHIRSATSGMVHGEGKPIHIGKTSQVWQTEIRNPEGKLLCISRCTIAVIPKK